MTDAIEAGARAIDKLDHRQAKSMDHLTHLIAKSCIEAAIASGALVPASKLRDAERHAKQAEACCDSYVNENQKLHDRMEAAKRRVAELEEELKTVYEIARSNDRRANDAERERDMLDEVICDTARELGCKSDNEEILFAIDKIRRERDEARAALKLIAEEYSDSAMPWARSVARVVIKQGE